MMWDFLIDGNNQAAPLVLWMLARCPVFRDAFRILSPVYGMIDHPRFGR